MSDELEAQHEAAREVVRKLRREVPTIDGGTLRLLLTEARTHGSWRDEDVTDEEIRVLYDILRQGPTSLNQQPARYLFLRSAEAKEKLIPALIPGNVAKVKAAPVCALICYDSAFYENLPRLFPANDKMRDMMADNPELAAANAFRNGTLQGAYFMIAARAIGLDCGPMSGFNNKLVDETMLAGTGLKSNFLCNIGHADESTLLRRLPKLEFDEVAEIL